MSAVAGATQVDRAALVAALGAVKETVPGGPAIISTDKMVLLSGDSEGLFLCASNRDAWVRVRVSEEESDLSVMADHSELARLLANVGNEVGLEEEASGLRVRWGRKGTSLIPGMGGDKFLPFPMPDGDVEFCAVPASSLLHILSQTAYAAAGEAKTISFRCVYLSARGGRLAGYGMGGGSNGALGAYAATTAKTETEAGVSIPREMARAVHGFLAAFPDQEVRLSMVGEDSRYLRFEVDGGNSLLVRSVSPEYAFPIQTANMLLSQIHNPLADFTCGRAELMRALRVAAQAAPLSGRVSFSLDGESLALNSRNPERSTSAEEEIPLGEIAVRAHETRDFNATYILGALGKLDGEVVRVRYITGGNGAAFTRPDSDDEIHLTGGLSTT